MESFIKRHWLLILSLVINVVFIALYYRSCVTPPKEVVKEVVVHHRDTVTVEKEQIRWKTKVVNSVLVDTFYVYSKDTVRVTVPVENKEYNDVIVNDSSTTEVSIKYHGAFSDIDDVQFVHHYNTKERTVIKQKKSGFGYCIGPSVSYGYGIGSPKYGTPFVGLSFTLGFSKIIK